MDECAVTESSRLIAETDDRMVKARALLLAAHEYWESCKRAGDTCAVRWIEDTAGRLLIFTRGEYRDTLMRNIEPMRPVMDFVRENDDGE